MEQQAKNKQFRAALIYGAILGLVSVFLSVIFHVMGLTMETWTGIVSFVVTIGVITYCLYAYRQEYMGGFAGYGQLVLMTVYISIVSSVIVTIYNFIFFTYIDPEATQKMFNMVYERMLNNPRIPEDMIDGMMEQMEKRFTKNRIILQGFLGGIFTPLIVGLIASAFIKKEPEAGPENV